MSNSINEKERAVKPVSLEDYSASYGINPYIYCASNPIRYTDPTGCVIVGMTNLVEDYLKFMNNTSVS